MKPSGNLEIFQAFGWELNAITESIKAGYFTGKANVIQITPMTGTKQVVTNTDDEYWIYYQPINFHIGNQLGGVNELKELTEVAHEHGIAIVADLVVRHMAGANDGSYRPNELVDPELQEVFLKDTIKGENPYNRNQLIYGSWGVPMVDYLSPKAQKLIKQLMDEYLECGVDGFRIDMGKHFALPSENPAAKGFWDLFRGIDIVYAECIDLDTWWLDRYINETGVMALTSYPAPTDKSKGVIFFESHDTYWAFGYTRKMSDEQRVEEWGYLKGMNRIFFCRPFDTAWGKIK